MIKKVLITGCGGYIGSVATAMFLDAGYTVVGVDNLSRGNRQPLEYLQKKHGVDKLHTYFGDIQQGIGEVFAKESGIDTVIHYAALCNVGESEKEPGMYFRNNVGSTTALLDAMKEYGVKKLVFSSTCSLYGEPVSDTLSESHPVNPTSHPYSESKYMSERIIDWFTKTYDMRAIFLRYFNVCGATDDGEIGDSKRPSFHLMQNAVRGALGIAPFQLNSTKVATPDGTPIRDYVNVVDLNSAHIKAVEYLDTIDHSDVFNLGTGKGNSVLEIIKTVESLTGATIPMNEGERRKGDVSKAVASNEKITRLLGWHPTHSIEDSVKSLVAWYEKHPQGWEY